MRAFIAFLLSCASVFGADGDIRVVTTARTNAETASITIKDFYTRDGQTNLVRHTKTKAGVVQIRIHTCTMTDRRVQAAQPSWN